jgi:hypothetical protein
MPPVFPYHEPVGNFPIPIQDLVFENGGVFFSMGYFSGRFFELTESENKPAVISLIDSDAKSRLVSLFRQSYTRAGFPGTSLYYAVHNAINRIDGWNVNGVLSSFDTLLLVTITDGLDTASTDPTLAPIDGLSFKNIATYQDFIKKTIEGKRIGEKKITAISIGIRGTDTVTERDYLTTLRAAASSDENAYRIPVNNLTKILQNIAVSVTGSMTLRPYGFITPVYPDGTEIFIALDGFSTPARGQNFIAGRVKVMGNRFYLENITLGGLAKEASSVPDGGVAGQIEPNGGAEWLFNFSETLTPSKMVLYYKTDKDWRATNEFAVRTYPLVNNKHSALVYLLIDNSVSMSTQNIAVIRESVTKFIDTLSINRADTQPLFSSSAALTMTQLRERPPEPELAAGLRQSEPQSEPQWEPPPFPEKSRDDLEVWFRPVPGITPESSPPRNLEPPKTPPPLSVPPIPQPVSGSKGYWVQTSSSDDRTAAEKITALLRQYRLTPVITEAQLQGKTFYRVRLGPYATLAEASLVADFVKKPPLGFYDSFIP